MSITFNQFLSRVDEGLSQYGSNRGVQLTPQQRAAVPSRIQRGDRNTDSGIWRALGTEPKKTKTPKPGGITFDSRINNQPRVVVQPTPEKVELGLEKLGKGTPEPVLTYNRSARKRGYKNPISLNTGKELTGAARRSRVRNLRKKNKLEEFLTLYRQSVINS